MTGNWHPLRPLDTHILANPHYFMDTQAPSWKVQTYETISACSLEIICKITCNSRVISQDIDLHNLPSHNTPLLNLTLSTMRPFSSWFERRARSCFAYFPVIISDLHISCHFIHANMYTHTYTHLYNSPLRNNHPPIPVLGWMVCSCVTVSVSNSAANNKRLQSAI